MPQRKVFRSGNSAVISLPDGALDCLQSHVGDHVTVELDWERRELVVRRAAATEAGVDEEFARQVGEFIAEYRSALEALAR